LNLGKHHDSIEILNEVKKSVEYLSDVEPKVYSNLSSVFAAYYIRNSDYENFYTSSL